MTIVETIVPLIVAVGGAGGGIYAVVKAFRERHGAPSDRESPVPQDRAAERSRCVTHAELAAALAQHRTEVCARVDEAEADCERRTQEAAERSAAQYERLAGQIGSANVQVAHVVGVLEGIRSGQPQSRRGR